MSQFSENGGELNAESLTSQARGGKDGVAENPDHTVREAGIGESREGDGGLDVRADRSTGKGESAFRTLTGGILAQLIKRTQDQLEEAKECIVWYQNQYEKLQGELTQLEELSKMLNRDLEEENNEE